MSHLFISIHDETLRPIYQKAIERFNASMEDTHRDSGFDIYTPKSFYIMGHDIGTLDTMISCAVYGDNGEPQPYYMYPRSSISKTPLRLANSVGIIDSGYRGNIMGKFDNIGENAYVVSENARYLQLCSHNLLPFKSVRIVDDLDSTTRGGGGFGSTGK